MKNPNKSQEAPELVLTANLWSLVGHPSPEKEWSMARKLEFLAAADFDAFSDNAVGKPDYPKLSADLGLRFAGAFDVAAKAEMSGLIAAQLAVDTGPINCQLADHDTPVDEAVELTIALMEEAGRQSAEVHLEVHRDTCTETPEKAYAIIEGYEKATGRKPRINFDYSHPAVIKHLVPDEYSERLIVRPDLLQEATLLHIRPFNGHHCQIPITDGSGGLSREYRDFRPFIGDLFDCWLAGPCPNNALWVVPELGPINQLGYGLSVFPNIVDDLVVLAREIRLIWGESLAKAPASRGH